jgi:hypothetical protein
VLTLTIRWTASTTMRIHSKIARPERILADGGSLYRPVWARVRFVTDEQGRVTELRFYDRFVATKVYEEGR